MTLQEIIETYGKEIYISFQPYFFGFPRGDDYSSENIRSVGIHFDGALFTSVMRCLDLVLEGDQRENIEKFSELRDFTVTYSANGEEKSVNYGSFWIGEEPEYNENENTTKYICYDTMLNTMRSYDAEFLINDNYTLRDFLYDVCLECNITIANIDDLKNGTMPITADPYRGTSNDEGTQYTYRDVLDEIARCAGCSFAFKSDANGDTVNQMYIIYVTDGNGHMKESIATLSIDNMKSLKIGEQYGPVDNVILSRQPQNDDVSYKGTYSVSAKLKQPEIADSYDDDERREWLADIFTAVNALTYYCYELESYGIGFLNFGDVFTILTYRQENRQFTDEKIYYTTVFMRSDLLFNGGMNEKSVLELPIATSDDDNYTKAETASEKMLKKAYMRVDKELNEIRSEVSDATGNASEALQTANGFETRITSAEGNIAQIQATANELTSRITDPITGLETKINQTANSIGFTVANALNGGICADVIINESGLTINNGALILKDSNGETTIQNGAIVSDNLKIQSRNITFGEETILIDGISDDLIHRFSEINSEQELNICSISELREFYEKDQDGWYMQSTSEYNPTYGREYFREKDDNNENYCFPIDSDTYYTLSFKYIIYSNKEDKIPTLNFSILDQSGETYVNPTISTVGVNCKINRDENQNFISYYEYGDYERSFFGKDFLRSQDLSSLSQGNLAVAAQNLKGIEEYLKNKLNNPNASDSISDENAGLLKYIMGISFDENVFALIKDVKLKTFKSATLDAGAILSSSSGKGCFNLDTGVLSCKSSRIGRIETYFDYWQSGLISGANRDIIISDGGLIISANNGSNKMILDFSELHFNGIQEQTTEVNSDTSWRYLIYDENTGKVRSKAV